MSAAAVALAETPRFVDEPVAIPSPGTLPSAGTFVTGSSFPSAERRLHDLVHDLRQPLSTIEAIAYYLEMTLPPGQTEARAYMSQLQRLVADTSTIIERSVGAPRKSCARAVSAR